MSNADPSASSHNYRRPAVLPLVAPEGIRQTTPQLVTDPFQRLQSPAGRCDKSVTTSSLLQSASERSAAPTVVGDWPALPSLLRLARFSALFQDLRLQIPCSISPWTFCSSLAHLGTDSLLAEIADQVKGHPEGYDILEKEQAQKTHVPHVPYPVNGNNRAWGGYYHSAGYKEHD